jgi:hypothetical protein
MYVCMVRELGWDNNHMFEVHLRDGLLSKRKQEFYSNLKIWERRRRKPVLRRVDETWSRAIVQEELGN